METSRMVRTTGDWTCVETKSSRCPIVRTDSGPIDDRGRIDRFYCEHGSIVHTICNVWVKP